MIFCQFVSKKAILTDVKITSLYVISVAKNNQLFSNDKSNTIDEVPQISNKTN